MSDPGLAAARIPAGARDMLPVEAAELGAIADRLRAHVALAGYREVSPPVLELAEVIDRGQPGASADAYRLFDDAGRVLVLRPDITIPVARLVATRMADHPGPVRVSYRASAFRPPRPGSPRPGELRQAGIELVGAGHPGADAEVLSLLVGALRAAGVPEPRVSLADVSLTRAAMDGAAVDEETRAALGEALAARDLVGWRRRARAAVPEGPAADLLAELPALRGGEEVLDRVRAAIPSAGPACDQLAATLATARRHGVGDELRIDLGVLRDWSYYSGIVFEAYGPGAAEPLGAGGRYDALGARFGTDRPAIGFAVSLDQVHRAVLAGADAADALRDGVVLVGGLDTHAALAARARADGITVVALAAGEDGRADALADADGWRFVARPGRDGAVEVLDRARGERRACRDLAEAVR